MVTELSRDVLQPLLKVTETTNRLPVRYIPIGGIEDKRYET